jgi:signal transduction histidine kinase/DNA-binding response OmpR family regulator
MRPFSRWSIEWKLPLGGGLLLLVVVGVLSSAAYREVHRETADAAHQRLSALAAQLADLFERSGRQAATQAATLAQAPALAAYLADSVRVPRESAKAALAYHGTQPQLVLGSQLLSPSGQILATGERTTLPTPTKLAAGFGPFVSYHDSIVYPTLAPIPEKGPSLGWMVVWRVLKSTPESRRPLVQLIGSNASIYLGNRDNTGWNDLDRAVPAPPTAITTVEAGSEYVRPNEGRRLGAARPIANSPWEVLIEFPADEVFAAARQFLTRGILVVGVLGTLALLVLWLLSRRITVPLRELTIAAEAVSAGDYSRRVQVNAEDELGRLARAFTEMAGRVEEAHLRLESTVATRTQELKTTLERLVAQERQLSVAKEAAEQANRAKSDFLAKMSHELRTPLNAVIGFSEVLQERTHGALTDKQARYVDNVLTSGRQLLDLINDILDLSKVEAGRMELVRSDFSIPSALEDVRTVVAGHAERKGIELRLELDRNVTRAFADHGKFKQIMQNLLSNAIKFTPDGGRIVVTTREIDWGGQRMVEFSVADNGIGIPREDHERIFYEFEQVDSPYAREQHGTGLGLALVRKLVHLHGGRIWVESGPGTGSTFRFTLPIESSAEPPPVAAEPATDNARIPGEGPLVLVVEDDPPASELLAHYLRDSGFRVLQTPTGEAALELARSVGPDAITLDIRLPGRHGSDILAELKGDPRTMDIPVVVVSITEDRELGLSLGAADWLVKPTRREDFIASVRRVASRGRSPGSQTVLIIDDDPTLIELLTDLLTSQGFAVSAAKGSSDGVTQAIADQPNVIILDLMMPDIDGVEVARRIRAHERGRQIPIVVFTVKDLSPGERSELERLAQAVVMKGRGRAALLRELERLVQRVPTEI